MHDPHEEKRLEILYQNARGKRASIDEQLSKSSLDINKERIQYFEKIALGCGATIALVGSFVGSRAGKLEPAWLLRSALLVLALAMVSAMYRNWRYPYYVLAAIYKQLDKAMLEEAECHRNLNVSTNALSLKTGQPIDIQEAERNFQRAKSALTAKINEFETQERRVSREIKFIEPLALILTTTGLTLLIALAWLNF